MATTTPTGTRIRSRRLASRGGPLGPEKGGRVITPKPPRTEPTRIASGPSARARAAAARVGGIVTPRAPTTTPAMTTGSVPGTRTP